MLVVSKLLESMKNVGPMKKPKTWLLNPLQHLLAHSTELSMREEKRWYSYKKRFFLFRLQFKKIWILSTNINHEKYILPMPYFYCL